MHIHGWRSSFPFPQRRRRNVATHWHCRPRHRSRKHHRPRNLRHWERHGVWKFWAGQVRVQRTRQAHRTVRHGWPIAWGQAWNGALQSGAASGVAGLAALGLAAPPSAGGGPGGGPGMGRSAGAESVQATLKTQQVSGHWSQSAPLRLGLWNLLADSGLDPPPPNSDPRIFVFASTASFLALALALALLALLALRAHRRGSGSGQVSRGFCCSRTKAKVPASSGLFFLRSLIGKVWDWRCWVRGL